MTSFAKRFPMKIRIEIGFSCKTLYNIHKKNQKEGDKTIKQDLPAESALLSNQPHTHDTKNNKVYNHVT